MQDSDLKRWKKTKTSVFGLHSISHFPTRLDLLCPSTTVYCLRDIWFVLVHRNSSVQLYGPFHLNLAGGFNPSEKYDSSKIVNLPQIGVKIKNIWKHHLAILVILGKCKLNNQVVFLDRLQGWSFYSPTIIPKKGIIFAQLFYMGTRQKMRKKPWNHPPIYRIYIGWTRSLGGYRHKNGWRINQSPLTRAPPQFDRGLIAGLLKGKPMINKLSSGRLGVSSTFISYEKFGPGHDSVGKNHLRRSWAMKKNTFLLYSLELLLTASFLWLEINWMMNQIST